jgi:hypothetical protein
MERRLSRDDLAQHFRTQFAFLQRSAAAFDNGYEDEAVRLATTIRVLVHDTTRSTALLQLLKVKHTILYVETSPGIKPGNPFPTPGLVAMEVDSETGVSYVARLGELPPERIKEVPFAQWWLPPVTKDTTGHLFARKDYVLNMANKEGGAHVDPKLTPTWQQLTRDNSLGILSGSGGVSKPMGTPAPACVRQIAWELETTVRAHLPSLL